MKEPICFMKPLVRIGGSFYVVVPKNAMTYLEAKKGDILQISAQIPKEEPIPVKLLDPYKKHLPQLEDFQNAELNSCMFLFSIENALELKEKAEFETRIKKERGTKFLEKYKIFKSCTTDKNAMRKIVEDSIRVSKEFETSIKASAGAKIDN